MMLVGWVSVSRNEKLEDWKSLGREDMQAWVCLKKRGKEEERQPLRMLNSLKKEQRGFQGLLCQLQPGVESHLAQGCACIRALPSCHGLGPTPGNLTSAHLRSQSLFQRTAVGGPWLLGSLITMLLVLNVYKTHCHGYLAIRKMTWA